MNDLSPAPVITATRNRSSFASVPNVAATSYRREIRNVTLAAGTGSSDRGVVQVVGPGRRGYALPRRGGEGHCLGGVSGRGAVVDAGARGFIMRAA